MSHLRKIRKTFDWDTYLHSKHTTVATGDPEEYRINCVSCGENDHKLYVHTERGLFHCFKCSFSSRDYDLFDFIAKTEGVNRLQAMKIASDLCRLSIPDDFEGVIRGELEHADSLLRKADRVAARPIKGMPEGSILLSDNLDNEDAKPFIEYLVGRGLTLDEIRWYQIYATPHARQAYYDATGKYRFNIGGRVLFPIYSPERELVSWIGRSLLPSEKVKYVNAPDSDLKKTFWPSTKPYEDHVILVEGVLDCMAMRRLKSPFSSYATFGKSLSSDQIDILLEWGVKEVTLFWDVRDAKPEMVKAADKMSMHFPKVNVLNMTTWPKAKDPGDMLKEPEGVPTLLQTVSKTVQFGTTEFIKWQIL